MTTGARRASAILALACLLGTAVCASAANRYDPRLRFRTIRTAHFDIHTHQGEETLAIRLAAIAERVRARFEPIAGVARGRVQVILVDQTDLSNGWATPFPYDTIEIDAVAPASETIIGNVSDWLEVAFTHEYTHILHLDRARGFMQGVRNVFGRAPLVFPNSYLPVWQIEGLAVFEESRMTGEGRIPEGDFRAIVDVAAAHGQFEPIDRAGGGLVDWPGGNAAYAYGAYFHQYLADRYGPERLTRLADATAGRLPLFGDGAFKTVFGRSSTDLWADFRASREGAAAETSTTDARATRLTHTGFSITALDVAPDGVIRYAESTADRFPGLMELQPGGKPRRIAWRAGGTRTSTAAGWVVFDQFEQVRSIALYSDLYAVRIADGRAVRLTREARAADPDVSADGRRIVCTVQATGRRALALLDFNAASPRRGRPRIIIDDVESDYTGPRWSSDGRSVVASRRREGVYEIVIIDPDAKTVRPIAARRDARLVTPSWTSDGQLIMFAANLGDAPFNVFVVSPTGGAVRQVTDTVGGAQFPYLSPSGTLTYVGYTVDGYDVFSVPTDPATWTSVPFDPSDPDPRFPVPDPRSPIPDPRSQRYQPLRTLAPTYWQPVIVSDYGETLVGAGTTMYDALGRHTYSVDAEWSVSRARPDWHASYTYDRWRPTLFATYSDETDPIRGGDLRSRALVAGALLSFRRIRRSETLMAAFAAENDSIAADPGVEFADAERAFRAIRAGWLHDSRRSFAYSISTEEGSSIQAAVETNRTAIGSDANGGSVVLDARAFQRVFHHTVFAARFALAESWGAVDTRRVFSAAGPGPSVQQFSFGRDTIGLLRGFNAEDIVGSRAADLNVDLRIPLRQIQRGAGTWPVFLRSVHAAAFVDAGHAWETQFHTADVRTSAGGEISFDTTLIHYTPVTFAAGVAWTHDPVANTSGAAAFGRIGYAF
jgi:hypothetical protein